MINLFIVFLGCWFAVGLFALWVWKKPKKLHIPKDIDNVKLAPTIYLSKTQGLSLTENRPFYKKETETPNPVRACEHKHENHHHLETDPFPDSLEIERSTYGEDGEPRYTTASNSGTDSTGPR